MSEPSSGPVTPWSQLEFTRTRLREGYDATAVDEFLHRAHRALQAADGSVTEQDVRDVRFDPVRMRTGYDPGEVDHELDRIAVALSQLEHAGGDHRRSSHQPESYVPQRPMPDGPDRDPISVAAFVRELPWILFPGVGLILVLYYFDFRGMRDSSVWEPVLVVVGFVVVFGPLAWLRPRQAVDREREFSRFLVGAIAWAVISMTVIVVLMYAFGFG